MQELEKAIRRFKSLHSVYSKQTRTHQRTIHHSEQFLLHRYHAHEEMFRLAQYIAKHKFPALQDELESARRAAIKALETTISTTHGTKVYQHGTKGQSAYMRPKKYTLATIVWSDIQITPEISSDFNLAGKVIPHIVAKRLIVALRRQIGALERLIRDVNFD